MDVMIYVLEGAWNTKNSDGCQVLCVSDDILPLRKRLDVIAENKAKDFVHDEMEGELSEDIGDRSYEVRDEVMGWACFYITEQKASISEPLMGKISREMERIDRTNDVRAYIEMLYESESIEAWKYEYMTREPAVMQEILQVFNKTEDCNTPFNTMMDIVVGNVMKEITLDDKKLEYLWEEFGDVLIDDDECILDDFLGFECGTHREAVWHWFDERYSGGVAKLMFGGGEDACKS